MIEQGLNIRDEFQEKVKNFCSLNNISWSNNIYESSSGGIIGTPQDIIKVSEYVDGLERIRLEDKKIKSFWWIFRKKVINLSQMFSKFATKKEKNMVKINTIKTGQIGLIQQTEDGRILQVAMEPGQNELLQLFLAELSNGNPLIQMNEEYDLVLKSSICKKCQKK